MADINWLLWAKGRVWYPKSKVRFSKFVATCTAHFRNFLGWLGMEHFNQIKWCECQYLNTKGIVCKVSSATNTSQRERYKTGPEPCSSLWKGYERQNRLFFLHMHAECGEMQIPRKFYAKSKTNVFVATHTRSLCQTTCKKRVCSCVASKMAYLCRSVIRFAALSRDECTKLFLCVRQG